MSFPIVYEDDYLIVVDKPPGLVVDPSKTQDEQTLADIMQKDFGINLKRGGIVHRLDKDTSGVMAVAKTQEVLESLQNQFKQRDVKKEYITLVHGLVEKEITVKRAIMRNPVNREKFMVDEAGREAETSFEPIDQYQMSNIQCKMIFEGFSKIQFKKLYGSGYTFFTLLRCFPLTGRTHQIRVHLKYTGFPIVGDSKYGGRKTARLDHRWCKRQFLHAVKLEFRHPILCDMMSFESELPEDLIDALTCLNVIDKNGQ